MAAKRNNLYRQFSFNDDDALENTSLVQSHLDPSAALTLASALVTPGTPNPSVKHSAPTGTVYGGTVSDSGKQMLDSLIWGDKWDNSQLITYYFDDADSVSPWTAVEESAFRAALQVWLRLIGITDSVIAFSPFSLFPIRITLGSCPQ